jgi:LPPG:FO 2-phospho-L-lactate transferase
MLVALTGGTGGAKLVHGLSLETDPQDLCIVCNSADDFVLHGLYISPDIDTITYTLAGVSDTTRGWGIEGDSFVVLEWLGKHGGETWFKIGDRDLATHITRSRLLREGWILSQVAEQLCKSLGVKATLVPATDNKVETRVVTPHGEISFQEYFVKNRWADEVRGVFFAGAEKSHPAPGVVKSIRDAKAVIICPSNPVTSIGPILAVPGIRATLRETKAAVIAVSPIIGGSSVSGPADKLMAAMEMEVSAYGVAKAYSDFLDVILIGAEDRELKSRIEEIGIRTVIAPIRMDSLDDKKCLAREVLALI